MEWNGIERNRVQLSGVDSTTSANLIYTLLKRLGRVKNSSLFVQGLWRQR